ncbi:hypothetical protein FQN50_004883 [Emmonsiellopsis sp. PD_5]|nr:hypothetical protein FQN50_004883 [Emmonsiellopsis sp. PD_5]
MPIHALLLAGGQSSRMGTRKELLHLPSNEMPLFLHLARLLKCSCPDLDGIHLSLKDRSSVPGVLQAAASLIFHSRLISGISASEDIERIEFQTSDGGEDRVRIEFLYDEDILPRVVGRNGEMDTSKLWDEKSLDIGPAAGLIAAYHADPSATWLVVACDFPFLTTSALKLLRQEHFTPAHATNGMSSDESLITCYRNAKGHCEPLLALWTPDALRMLERNVKQGKTGPRFVIEELGPRGVRTVSPGEERWLFNANTEDDWKEVRGSLGIEGEEG